MRRPKYTHADYLPYIRTHNLRRIIRRATKRLRDLNLKFDAIAFSGVSGALLAPPIALALNKTLLLVRKNITDGHSNHYVEGDIGARRYIIVDDFMSRGVTLRRIVKHIKKNAPNAKCIGVLEIASNYHFTPYHKLDYYLNA